MSRNTRRKILKQSGAAITGLTSLTRTTGAGSSPGTDDEDETDEDGSNQNVTGGGIQDESELPEYLQSSQGDVQQDGETPSVSRDHLKYVDHLRWETTLHTVQDLTDVTCRITLQEAIDNDGNPVTGSDDDYWYVIEFQLVSEEYDHLLHDGATTQLETGVELESWATAQDRDPATTSYVNGEWITHETGGQAGGIGFSSSQEIWADHGQIGPEYWTPGPGGKYGLEFDGSSPGGDTMDFLGSATVSNDYRADEIGDVVDYWESYCKAYLKTI